MPETPDKARALKLERLHAMLDKRLDNPAAALEALLSEMTRGEPAPELWERLHAAAIRDGRESDLARAYERVATPRRLKSLPATAHAEVLMHAADFFLGILGDQEGSAGFLERVLRVTPNHGEAFSRLKTRFERAGDRRKLAELYALVAADPPRPTDELARDVVNTVVPLPAKTPLSDEACRNLVALASTNLRVLDVIDAHCCKTERAALACEIREAAVERLDLADAKLVEQRRRLVELYLGDAKMPDRAIDYVEDLLARNPEDKQARSAAQKLLSSKTVASRAAAALQAARRQSLPPRS